MSTDIKISELNEIGSNKTINQLIVNDRSNSSDPGITRKISVNNLLPTYSPTDINKRAIVTNETLVSTSQSPGNETVNTNVIRDSAITESKIATGSVTSIKIANQTIVSNNIATNTIQGSNIDTSTTIAVASVSGQSILGENLQISGTTTFNTRQYTWPSSYTGDRYLRVDSSGNLTWSQPVQGSGTTLVFNEVLPVGSIIPWTSNSVPDNYLLCDGSIFNGTSYPELSAILGTTYGARSGNNFKLPDLRGKITLGAGTNVADISGNTSSFTIGASGGEYRHAISIDEMPSHSHDIVCRATIQSGGAERPPTDSTGGFLNYITEPTGGNQLHNNVQPYVVTNYIIKAKPDPRINFALTIASGLSANTGTGNIDLSGGTIKVRTDNQTITINGSNNLSVATGGISGQQLTGQQTGVAPIYGARAWAYFDCSRNSAGLVDSSNTARLIRGSGNVSSITKIATGRYSIIFTIPMPTSNYALVGCGKGKINVADPDEGTIVSTYFQQTTGCLLNITDPTGNNYANPEVTSVTVFC